MLSEGIATSRGRSGAYLHRDQVNHRVRGRRGARLTAITSGGAIPDTAQYQWSPSRKAQWSARWTKISRWRAWRATCSCWAPLRGASSAWSRAACAWRMRTARRRRFRSGMAKRPDARGSCREAVGEAARRDRAHPRSRAAVPDRRMRTGSTRGAKQAVAYVRGGRGVAGRAADAEDRGRRALLRRRRRHAAGDPRAVRIAHQSGLGTGAAQALLPLVQFRIAGRGHRQRHRTSR